MPNDPNAAVWEAARPYMRSRGNDIHIPLSYADAQWLLTHHPEADSEVVLLSVLLHDIGWAVLDQDRIISEGFGPGMMESEIRFAHEREGARLAREILDGLDYPADLIDEVAAIVDGHDTRVEPLSRNDELMKDCDRLWRFGIPGVALSCLWTGRSPAEYYPDLERQLERFFTSEAESRARGDLARTVAALKLDLLPAEPVQR
ncbi:MAG TPA: HD domain-containing protein [Thermoleophilaceae bacterium]|jgi:HD superfamily phosphodiesterase